MLVLSRKKDELIWIGDDIRIKVIRITGGGVRLGIEAPEDVRIARGELRGIQINNEGTDKEVD